MKLLLNHGNVEEEINNHLKRLRDFSVSEKSKADIDKIAKCVSQIHSYNLNQSNLPLYNSQWDIDLVTESKDCIYKKDIISALKMMSEMEYYTKDAELKFTDKKFLTWDISVVNWQKEYKTGQIGNYVWDIAAIINYVKDSSFSDTFLESYIFYGDRKPTLIAIYTNLYYVQVAEAAMSDNFEDIIPATKEITEQNIFQTELISYETLNRLQILGY